MPVVNVGSKQNPSYLPAQVCDVIGGQHTSTKLSPVQTQNMIRYAVRPPEQNARFIATSGVNLMGLEPTNSTLVSPSISVGTIVTHKRRNRTTLVFRSSPICFASLAVFWTPQGSFIMAEVLSTLVQGAGICKPRVFRRLRTCLIGLTSQYRCMGLPYLGALIKSCKPRWVGLPKN
jgi:hypothetical protein